MFCSSLLAAVHANHTKAILVHETVGLSLLPFCISVSYDYEPNNSVNSIYAAGTHSLCAPAYAVPRHVKCGATSRVVRQSVTLSVAPRHVALGHTLYTVRRLCACRLETNRAVCGGYARGVRRGVTNSGT